MLSIGLFLTARHSPLQEPDSGLSTGGGRAHLTEQGLHRGEVEQ